MICCIAYLLIVSAGNATAADLIPLSQEQRINLGIEVRQVEIATSIPGRQLPAEVVVPNEQLFIISTQQPGLVHSLLVSEGDVVARDQVVATLQSLELLGLQRDYLQSLSAYELARNRHKRMNQGMKEELFSVRQLQEIKNQLDEVSAKLRQEKETLRLSGMTAEEIRALESEKKLSSYVSIRSPIDGVVLEQMISPGERVDAATALYKVGYLKPLWLEIHAPLEVTESVTSGDRVNIEEYDIEGEILTLGRQVHAADQGIMVRAIVDEGAERLRPGQFVQVRLAGKNRRSGSYLVATPAIVHSGGKTFVFVESGQGFQPVEVSVVATTESGTIIEGELTPDASIAVRGIAGLKSIFLGLGGEG